MKTYYWNILIYTVNGVCCLKTDCNNLNMIIVNSRANSLKKTKKEEKVDKEYMAQTEKKSKMSKLNSNVKYIKYERGKYSS